MEDKHRFIKGFPELNCANGTNAREDESIPSLPADLYIIPPKY